MVPLEMANEQSCGCGASGNGFNLGQFVIKNSGDYEVTIEIQVTSGGRKLQAECDPRVQVGP
jgi:hypothetical protein